MVSAAAADTMSVAQIKGKMSFFIVSERRTPNDPKLSDGGGLARPLHGGGKAAAEAAGVTDRSRSLQRMVRRCGDSEGGVE